MNQLKRYIPVLLSPYLLVLAAAALVKSALDIKLVLFLLLYDIIVLISVLQTLKKTPAEDREGLYRTIKTVKLAQIPAYIIAFVLLVILILRSLTAYAVPMIGLPLLFAVFLGPFALLLLPLIFLISGIAVLPYTIPVAALIALEAFGLILSAILEVSSLRALYHGRRMNKIPCIVLSLLQFIYCADVVAALLVPQFIKE
jgi:hypothetical protein